MRGAASHALGDVAHALDGFERAQRLSPHLPAPPNALATVLHEAGRGADALSVLQAAMARGIRDHELALNLALILDALGRRPEAVGVLDALLVEGDAVPAPLRGAALLTRAALRLAGRDAQGALGDARASVALVPQRSDAWFNRAEAALAAGEPEEARDAALRAVELDPGNGFARIDVALATAVLGEFVEAERALAVIQAQQPEEFAAFRNAARPELEAPLRHLDMAGLFAEWHHERARRCDWRLRGLFERRLVETLVPRGGSDEGGMQTSIPFRSLAVPLTLEARGRLAAGAGRLLARHAGKPLPPVARRPRRPGEPLRIGYLSADFREHPLGWLTRDLYAAHDRTQVRVTAYSVSALPDDPVTRSIVAGVDDFRRCAGLDGRDIAQLVREDAIDVLVDLSGYQLDARLDVFALGAAPVQVAWLAYPGSTGIPAIGHALVDPVACPPGSEVAWTERLFRMPGTYFLGGDGRVPEVPGMTRESLGLPEDALVLCGFNQPWKLEPAVFSAWMQILRALPKAVLWLYGPTEEVSTNLREQARRVGIHPERLVFATAIAHDAHLARCRLADLFLDAWVCNAHTTAADALAAGVPLVTLAGTALHQRVGASLLSALGCPELVAPDPAAYVRYVIDLASNSCVRKDWATRLREGRNACDLFSPERKARALEVAFQALSATA